LEEKEKLGVEEDTATLFARKESKFRQQQQAELQALLKRIDARRKEHIKQRNLDSKRLMQRNRNVQAVLESKQAVESNRVFTEIRKNLTQSSFRNQIEGTGGMPSSPGPGASRDMSRTQKSDMNMSRSFKGNDALDEERA
jgi:hypothetical protein